MYDISHLPLGLSGRIGTILPNLPPVRRLGREYGLGNSSSRSWVWAHFAVGAKHDTRYVCSEPRTPRPRNRGLGKRSGPTATPAFEPAFEFSRALVALSSSSASGSSSNASRPPTLAGASVFVGPRLDDLGVRNSLHGLLRLYILSVSCVL